MKRSLPGLLASLLLGAAVVLTGPAPASADAAEVDVAQVQPAGHDDDKGDDNDGADDASENDDKGDEAGDHEDRDDDGDDNGKKHGDEDDDGDGRDRDGDGRRCVGLIVICIG